jgi:hypothetical protein
MSVNEPTPRCTIQRPALAWLAGVMPEEVPMAAMPGLPGVGQNVRRALASKAFLYDRPDDYLAGVEDAVKAIVGPNARLLVVDEGGREEWLRTLEQYRVACGPPASAPARVFESKLERQLSA